MAFGYVYDNVGNITQETRDGATTTYVYDHLGQLTRVNDPNDTTSGSSGTTWVYNYDCGGNITSKKRYAYTTGNLGTLKQTIRLSTRAYQCLCIHNCPSLPQSVRPLLELALAHCSHSQLYSLN